MLVENLLTLINYRSPIVQGVVFGHEIKKLKDRATKGVKPFSKKLEDFKNEKRTGGVKHEN